MTLFKAVELKDGADVQYVGVYILKWRPEWGKPTIGFIEYESPEEEFDRIEDLEKARTALREIDRLNRVNNDLGAYLSAMAEWGLGELDEKPKLEDFGLIE